MPSSSTFLTSPKGRQKIKNPASSAGHSRLYLATLRETRQDLPGAARKVPHSRILRLPYRSDCDSPDWPKDFGKPLNRESVYRNPKIRQAPVKNIFPGFPQPCGWPGVETGPGYPNANRKLAFAFSFRASAVQGRTTPTKRAQAMASCSCWCAARR